MKKLLHRQTLQRTQAMLFTELTLLINGESNYRQANAASKQARATVRKIRRHGAHPKNEDGLA